METLVYCPRCGTSNKSTSRFCRDCSGPLIEPNEIRCPVCGFTNDEGDKTCSRCGARLTPALAKPGAQSV